MAKKATAIPKAKDIGKDVAPLAKDAEKVTALIAATVVEDDAAMEAAVAMAAEIKDRHREVDEKRKSWTDPLRMVIDDINTTFRPALEALKEAEAAIKAKVSGYVSTSMARRDHILATVHAAPPEKREALVERADALVPKKVSGLSVRGGWTGEVLDRGAVVKWAVDNGRLELLSVDEKALKAITKSAGRDPGIPGWRAFADRSVAVTTSRVKR